MAVYDVDGNVVCGEAYPDLPDENCTAAFVSYMAKKCTQFGMTDTTYENPSGLTDVSRSSPRDEMKLGLAVAASQKGMDIWATRSQLFNVYGDHARSISIDNAAADYETGLGAILAASGYTRLGGKSGSLTRSGYHKAGIQMVDINGVAVILGAMATGQTTYNNFDVCIKEICDVINATLNGNEPVTGENLQVMLTDGGGYAACIVPNTPGAYLNIPSPADMLARSKSVSSAPSVKKIPASTTKTMTMLCALDYIRDPFETITVKSIDISSGSGSTFYDGDIINIMDALKIMMMESSNTLANAIARHTGKKILAFG